jgi:flagellar capping protein FliD
MATTVERLGIVETKVTNLDEKLDNLKVDVKEMHDCLDKARDELGVKLDTMYQASCQQHDELAKKISAMERLKDKWMYTVAGGMIVLSWATAHADIVLKFIK